MVTLEQRGLIGRTPGRTRSIRVLLPPTTLPDLPSGRRPPQSEPAAEAAYPHLARWLADAGTIERAMAGHAHSMARSARWRDRLEGQEQLPESG